MEVVLLAGRNLAYLGVRWQRVVFTEVKALGG